MKIIMSLLTVGCITSSLSMAPAQEAAHFRGPNHNGTYPNATIRTNWKENPPQALWRKDVGYGFSGVAVAGNRALTAGYDLDTKKSTLFCFNTDTGAEEWQIPYADTCGGRRRGLIGPIPTPVIDGDRVYVVAAMGALYCFDLAKGGKLWEQITNHDKESGKPHGEYGDGASPVIAGDLVIVHLTTNADSAAWFAFSRKDGRPVWSSPIEKRQVKDETADRAYSPAAAFDFKGKPHLILISNDAIDGVDATTGSRAWTYPTSGLQMQYGPFPEPFFFDKDKFFLGMWYNEKANGIAFKVTDTGLAQLWANNAIGKGAYSYVVRDGYLYGFGVKGLNCVNLADGNVKWKWRSSDPATAKDQGEVILVGDKLVWLSSSGTLYVGEASPDKSEPIASFKAIARCTKDLRKDKAQYNNVISTSPVFAGGRLYCRSSWGDLVCVDVR